MTFQKAVVTTALCLAILLGLAVGGVECYHLAHREHAFSWVPFAFSLAAILFPALAIQKGDIGGSFKLVADEIPLMRLGRRETDPVVPVQAVPPVSPNPTAHAPTTDEGDE